MRRPSRCGSTLVIQYEDRYRAAHTHLGPKETPGVSTNERMDGKTVWPALRSIADLLKREGLPHPSQRRKRTLPYTQPLAAAQGRRTSYGAGFKGGKPALRPADGDRAVNKAVE